MLIYIININFIEGTCFHNLFTNCVSVSFVLMFWIIFVLYFLTYLSYVKLIRIFSESFRDNELNMKCVKNTTFLTVYKLLFYRII